MPTSRSAYYDKKVFSIKSFDYTLDYKNLDLRKQPELYRIGVGEQGVLMIEPYKSEILPHRRFKTPDIALQSATHIYGQFNDYLDQQDFVGADMARKFLQMGFTRSRRYANHTSGRKYKTNPQLSENDSEFEIKKNDIIPQETDALTNDKAKSASIFYEYYAKAKDDPRYLKLKQKFKDKYYPI